MSVFPLVTHTYGSGFGMQRSRCSRQVGESKWIEEGKEGREGVLQKMSGRQRKERESGVGGGE